MAPDGSMFFGVVPDAVASHLGVAAGEIRLLNGFDHGGKGFGLAHLAAKPQRILQMKGLGFRNIEQFVWHVCQNFTRISNGGGRLGLCAEYNHHTLVAYVDWRAERSLWSVVTALPMRTCREPILWEA